MVSIQGGSGGGGGFDYVQDPSPQNPEEGEEWYDTGSDRAFVYDGSTWIEQTIGSHDKLSNVTASQHHSRPSSTQGMNSNRTWGAYLEGRNASFGQQPVAVYADGLEINFSIEYTSSIKSREVYINGSLVYQDSTESDGTLTVTFSDRHVETWNLNVSSKDGNLLGNTSVNWARFREYSNEANHSHSI